jgi:aminoglycoside phosphotransferase (APT) family kinase protein
MTLALAETAPNVDPKRVLNSIGFGARDIVSIKGGWDTLIWRFRDDRGELLSLRVYWLPDREESSRKEEIALRHCEAAGIAAPRVRRTGHVENLPFAVLSWVPGRPVFSEVERKPWRLFRLAGLMGAAQAALHTTPPPEEFQNEAPECWTRLVQPGYENLADELGALQAATSSFIHMDFHPLNVLAEERNLTGIVDWAGAAAGDPRADLARTEVTIETAPIPPGPLRPVLAALRGLMIRGWRDGYRSAAGSIPEYRPFKRWAAASLLREVSRVVGRPAVWAGDDYLACLRRIASAPPSRAAR